MIGKEWAVIWGYLHATIGMRKIPEGKTRKRYVDNPSHSIHIRKDKKRKEGRRNGGKKRTISKMKNGREIRLRRMAIEKGMNTPRRKNAHKTELIRNDTRRDNKKEIMMGGRWGMIGRHKAPLKHNPKQGLKQRRTRLALTPCTRKISSRYVGQDSQNRSKSL